MEQSKIIDMTETYQSRTVRLGSMVTGDREHNVYPGSGPLDGGKTLRPARLILMSVGVTRVDLP